MVEKEKIETPPDASQREKSEPSPDERAARLASLRADISSYRGPARRADVSVNEPDLSFPGIGLSSEAATALKLKMEEESSLIEGQRKAYEEKWNELLLGDEPLYDVNLSFDDYANDGGNVNNPANYQMQFVNLEKQQNGAYLMGLNFEGMKVKIVGLPRRNTKNKLAV